MITVLPDKLALKPVREGVTLVECLVVIAIFATSLGFVLSGVQRTRSSAARAQCQSQLRQIEMAQHSFLAREGYFPEGLQHITQLKNSRGPGLSWPSRILPELEQVAIWSEVQNAHHRSKWRLCRVCSCHARERRLHAPCSEREEKHAASRELLQTSTFTRST